MGGRGRRDRDVATKRGRDVGDRSGNERGQGQGDRDMATKGVKASETDMREGHGVWSLQRERKIDVCYQNFASKAEKLFVIQAFSVCTDVPSPSLAEKKKAEIFMSKMSDFGASGPRSVRHHQICCLIKAEKGGERERERDERKKKKTEVRILSEEK